MKRAFLTMADIGNAIEATDVAIESLKSIIDSNTPVGPKNLEARKLFWTAEDRTDYDEWTAQLKRFRGLRKKLLTIERKA